MPRKKRCKVFVSYSRHDEELVKPLAGLLGAAANDAVFLDVTSIKPGEVWKSEIETALREAPVFVLCWCCESQNSSVVAWEIATAMLWGGGESASCPTLPSAWIWALAFEAVTDHLLVDIQSDGIHIR